MKRFLLVGLFLSSLWSAVVSADTIVLLSGRIVTGKVLQTNENNNSVMVLGEHSTSDFYIPEIKSVTLSSQGDLKSTASTNRSPEWKVILFTLSRQPWATNIKQIPATVIEKGVFRHVPYVSFRCGVDYELNIYGDLDNPAGFEIGAGRKLANDPAAQKHCIEFVKELLPALADKEAVAALDRAGASNQREGLTMEVTPPTAEDSYGGWWVSVYEEPRLELARATERDLKEITVPRTTANSAAGGQPTTSWTQADLKQARPVAVAPPPTVGGSVAPAGVNSGGDGNVYVRGYTRKDGTYVQSHIRHSPRSR